MPLIVVPAAPANVICATPLNEILFADHVMAEVAVIVLPPVVPIVTFGTLNAPAV